MSDADDRADLDRADSPEAGDGPGAPYRPAPRTGDASVDEALGELEQATRDGDLDAQAQAGERVHARLQERLQDLGRG